MRRIIIPAACVALALLCGCNFRSIKGSGVSKTETRTVGTFTKIEVTGAPDVDVVVGSNISLTITADDNLLPLIETKVDGDTLSIGSKESYSTTIGVKLKITVPKLDGASITGSGDINAHDVKAGTFSASVTGSGDIHVTGTADVLDGEITGSGDVKAGDFVTKKATFSVTGSGVATVHATDSVDASVTGSGSVHYVGKPPQVNKRITGSGEVGPK